MRIKLEQDFFPGRVWVKIAAVDPGPNTGVVSATLLRTNEPGVWDLEYSSSTLHFPDDAVQIAGEALNAADVVVIEDYIPGSANIAASMSADGLAAIQAIGYIKGRLVEDNQLDILHPQRPASIAGLDRYVEQRVNYWPTTPHERDALKHVIVYLMGWANER